MQPSIPIAADNICKFAALFGLVVMISSVVAMLYLIRINYEFGVSSFDEFELLEVKESLSQAKSIRKNALEQIFKIRTFGTEVFTYLLDFFVVIGALFCFGEVIAGTEKFSPSMMNCSIYK